MRTITIYEGNHNSVEEAKDYKIFLEKKGYDVDYIANTGGGSGYSEDESEHDENQRLWEEFCASSDE